MDFWGIDRSKNSPRYAALLKLGRIDARCGNGDMEKMAKALVDGPTADPEPAPMTSKEFEVLLAIPEFVIELPAHRKVSPLLKKQLETYFSRRPQQRLLPSQFLRNLPEPPWYLVTRLLTTALIHMKTDLSIFEEFMHEMEQQWSTGLETEDLFIWTFTLFGFLTALDDDEVTLELAAHVHDWLATFATTHFLNMLSSRLSEMERNLLTAESDEVQSLACQAFINVIDNPELCPGSAQFELSVSRLSRRYLRVMIASATSSEIGSLPSVKSFKSETSGSYRELHQIYENHHVRDCDRESPIVKRKNEVAVDTSLTQKQAKLPNTLDLILFGETKMPDLDTHFQKILKYLTDYSVERFRELENSRQFRTTVTPHLIPITSKIIWNYFEILGAALHYQTINSDLAYEFIISAASGGQFDVDNDSVYNFVRLCFIVSKNHEGRLAAVLKLLPSYLGVHSPEVSRKMASIVAHCLKALSQSWLISFLYGMMNELSQEGYLIYKTQASGSSIDGCLSPKRHPPSTPGSHITELSAGDLSFSRFASSVLAATICVVSIYGDPKAYNLAIAVLSQKITVVNELVDAEILKAFADISPFLNDKNFGYILQQFERVEAHAKSEHLLWLTKAVSDARLHLSKKLPRDSELYQIYLEHLLMLIISKGESAEEARPRNGGQVLSRAAYEVIDLLEPLGALLPDENEEPFEIEDWNLIVKFRDVWFNLTVLGLNKYNWTDDQLRTLRILARSSPPLVSETSANKVESDLELNAVLRRYRPTSNVLTSQRALLTLLSGPLDLRNVSTTKVLFMTAAHFLASSRARGGVISKVLYYFGDPDFRTGEGYRNMRSVALDCTQEYLSHVGVAGRSRQSFMLDAVANELKQVLILCCHRTEAIRTVALEMADLIVDTIPSALCHQTSMFALLDLLTLVWQSCVDAEEDEYEPRIKFHSVRTNITIELSDSYELRKKILEKLLQAARRWSSKILRKMSLDVKSILSFYLDSLETGEFTFDNISIGRSFALEMGGTVQNMEFILGPNYSGNQFTKPDRLADGSSGFLSQYLCLSEFNTNCEMHDPRDFPKTVQQLEDLINDPHPSPEKLSSKELRKVFSRSAPLVIKCTPKGLKIAKDAVHIPFRYFSSANVQVGISFWYWMVNSTPELREPVLQAVVEHWCRSVFRKIGLFSRALDTKPPLFTLMRYAPSNKKEVDHLTALIEAQYAPHLALIEYLKSTFHSSSLCSEGFIDHFGRIIFDTMYGLTHYASRHPLSMSARLDLINLAFDVYYTYLKMRPHSADRILKVTVIAALSWYKQPRQWPFGGNLVLHRKILSQLETLLDNLAGIKRASVSIEILMMLSKDELNRLKVWISPLDHPRITFKTVFTAKHIHNTWQFDPELAVYLAKLSTDPKTHETLKDLITKEPLKAINVSEAVKFYIEARKPYSDHYILYYTDISPIESVNLFGSRHNDDPYLMQFTMRSLQTQPITDCFFYVPQIVQMLRYDRCGYVEEYVIEAAKFSEKFAHQMIWNMKANMYRDDDAKVPDPIKPMLDRVVQRIINGFTEEAKGFYEREFGFFNTVTSISGKLKPFIKRSKAEKKSKIDEELSKVKLAQGVYLPSNPDGEIVDIDRLAGKPLQSHAKAPFLARFKIRKDEKKITENNEECQRTVEVWQDAIFKVGDDCRQDMLALQIIAVFRNIFSSCGLDLYVYPYRVLATSPGCGIIDVLPYAISRDMLGREAVNGLYEWFVSKHGTEDSLNFQKARNSFVKSMAAYSVISYLIQFKDRHNGNIMYDDDGHVIHIDFGFCFEKVPGGVKFEAAPFKLTREMVAVMGGSTKTQAYHWFEELCVKAFLVSRVYADDICRMVEPMLGSGLPCFKGETIKKLRARFKLKKTEPEAAHYMRTLISESYESNFTKGYDEFQWLTNKIPY